MSIKSAFALAALLLASCGQGRLESEKKTVSTEEATPAPIHIAGGTQADRLLVDKSDRVLIVYSNGKEITRYSGIRFGDEPLGHKQFEGDEKTPEGDYTIDGRNPGSSYHLSLRISYPNDADKAYAAARGRSAGGDIFIHGQPNGWNGSPIGHDWTDGCIALSNGEIEQLWKLVPDGVRIVIQP